MAEWTTCEHCELKHARRPDGNCPRCKQSVLPGVSALGATASRPSYLESIGTTDSLADEARANGRLDLMLGALILGVGAVVTVVTYQMSAAGGTYQVVAIGAAIFGGRRVLRGIYRVLSGRSK